jgi:hypothetical protein
MDSFFHLVKESTIGDLHGVYAIECVLLTGITRSHIVGTRSGLQLWIFC